MTPQFWQYLLTIDPSGRRFRELIEALGTSSLEPVAALTSHPAFRPEDRAKLNKLNPKVLEKALAAGAYVLRASEVNALYAEAEFAVPALFARGDRSILDRPTVAIVGTRTCSPYGQACAQKFAESLARAGVTIVSGGAFGIDAAAHVGAVKGGGASVAVMGTGIDIFYPSTHRNLYEEVLRDGLVLSQFPAGMGSYPSNFPTRNPTIAALSQAVIVIEAPQKSGALRTASSAAELGRDVMVVPGPITSFGFAGSHGLIRDGATLVDHPRQVLEAIGVEEAMEPASESTSLSEIQERILAALTDVPMSGDKIGDLTGISDEDLLVELTMLEMEGVIFRHSAGYARKP